MDSPLKGIVVLDLTQAMAGPYATMILGDLGAEVIKVERPGVGDQSRAWGPPFLAGESAYFLAANRNKRGLTLNLQTGEGVAIVQQLAAKADILVTNVYQAETRRKYGIDFEALQLLNPRLIYALITGYGMTGSYSERPGYDVVAQGESGLMSITGEPDGEPMRYPAPIADMTTGIYCALGILAALFARERTGKGQHLDLSLLECQTAWLANIGSSYLATGEPPKRVGNQHPQIVPYQPFRARDKFIIVSVATESQWEKFCKILGVADTLMTDRRFATNTARSENRAVLIPLLEAIICQQPAEYWLARFREAALPCGPINTVAEALNDPHLRERGIIVNLEHPLIGMVRSIASPLRLSDTPVTYRLPPPTLGQHTEEILAALGYGPEKCAELRAKRVI